MTESPETPDRADRRRADGRRSAGTAGRAPAGPPRVPRPTSRTESEIAADYLEELLDIADLDGDIDMDVEGDRAAVSVVGGDLDDLVGREGKVLEALQELTRLAVLTADRGAQPADAGHRRLPGRAPGGAGRARPRDRASRSRRPVRRCGLDPMTPVRAQGRARRRRRPPG